MEKLYQDCLSVSKYLDYIGSLDLTCLASVSTDTRSRAFGAFPGVKSVYEVPVLPFLPVRPGEITI